jgi:hypothetical protein
MTKTIQISNEIHQKLKIEATQKGIGIRELVEEKLS